MLKKLLSMLVLSMLCACSSSNGQLTAVEANAQYNKPRQLDNFADYVQFLKGKALAQGVSAKVLNAQQNIRYIQKAVDLDRQQAGRIKKPQAHQVVQANPHGATRYLNRVLTERKVEIAHQRYFEQTQALEFASKKFSVQKEYLMALWGMESSFGYYQGNYDVLSVLATLAFEGRREALFSKEFIAAMKMLERQDIPRHKMLGSWAGAMGQSQFMPSSYLKYAVDSDKNGEKDIWKNHHDVFASIANYLHTVGWDNQLPWGVEVVLTQPMDLSLAGTQSSQRRNLAQWQQMGVQVKYQNAETSEKLTTLSHADLWLVRPDKEAGRAFLVTNNFRTLLDWNKSNYFALSIGMFADRIKASVQ